MSENTVEVAEPVTAAQTLRDAATYLAEHGWIQGPCYDMSSSVLTPAACAADAIAIVCYGGPVEAPAHMFADPGYPAFDEAMRVLELYLFLEYGFDSVYAFNDARDRTAAEVIRVLNAADLDRCIARYTVTYAAKAALTVPARNVGGAS